MTTMIIEIYEALKEAGASGNKAQSAAKALADYDNCFSRLEAELAIIKWIVSGVGFGVLLLVIKSFLP